MEASDWYSDEDVARQKIEVRKNKQAFHQRLQQKRTQRIKATRAKVLFVAALVAWIVAGFELLR